MNKQFEIELPKQIKIRDYIQSTPNYDKMFDIALFGRVYSILKRTEGNLLHYITKNNDKQMISEHWVIKID